LKTFFIIIYLYLFSIGHCFSQEWGNLKSYLKETTNTSLKEGCWLKKDRVKQNEIWNKANEYNLTKPNGYKKYNSIAQIRDFYFWFDHERIKQGHEIRWIGVAGVVANQLSKIEIGIISLLLVRNNEVDSFAKEGSRVVFQFAFPLLKEIYFSKNSIEGEKAKNWEIYYGKKEQCEILKPIYKNLSFKALKKLDKMAKGRGLFRFGVPKSLIYEGEIEDCQTRYNHGVNKLIPYYLNNYSEKAKN
jgi:hypothetical protein